MKTANNLRWLQSWQLYEKVPMKNRSILPDEGFPPMLIELTPGIEFWVHCEPKPLPGQRWGHRVFALCKCGWHVPFGRMCQHYDSATCRKG